MARDPRSHCMTTSILWTGRVQREDKRGAIDAQFPSKRIARVISVLKSAGHDVWIDVEAERGGDLWRKQIVQAIEASERVVIVLSKNSIASDNVRRELDVALESSPSCRLIWMK